VIGAVAWRSLKAGQGILRIIGAFTLLGAPWLGFTVLYFGSPVPNTLKAKGVIRPGAESLLFQAQHFARLSQWYLSGAGIVCRTPFCWFWVALLILGAYVIYRTKQREALLLTLFPLVYAVVMYFGRAPMYQWYLLPMLFCCLFLAGLGLGQIITYLSRKGAAWRFPAAMGAAVLLALGTL
jgi:hypothetical protein